MIPCKDCICLAICKNRLTPGKTIKIQTQVFVNLIPKCKILEDFLGSIREDGHYYFNPGKMDQILEFYGYDKEFSSPSKFILGD